jgi:DNA-directed RNA polymerase specialized sigma24 family protein
MSQLRSKGKNDPFLWDDFDSTIEAENEKPALLLRRAERVIRAIAGRLGWKYPDREDHRQDVLLSLLSKIRKSKIDPGASPIQKYDAYVAQSSFNVSKRKHPRKVGDQETSLDENCRIEETPATAYPNQAEILVMREVIRRAWQECVAVMSRDELAVFLFDKNDILWQLICMSDPIRMDEIAEGQ